MITLNEREIREFRMLRNAGRTARDALAIIRHNRTIDTVDWMLGEPFERDGFIVLVRATYEEDPDISHLGTFTSWATSDHSEGEFLQNPNGWTTWRGGAEPNHRNHQYFELANPVRSTANDLIRLHYGRRQAWELAWQYAKRDLESALDYAAYNIDVVVSRRGVELGFDSLGEVEADCVRDIIGVVLDGRMIENAIDDARANLADLCAG